MLSANVNECKPLLLGCRHHTDFRVLNVLSGAGGGAGDWDWTKGGGKGRAGDGGGGRTGGMSLSRKTSEGRALDTHHTTHYLDPLTIHNAEM
jgi:hypothetical protein